MEECSNKLQFGEVMDMKTALFVDFDNVYSGLRRISAQAADRFARRPASWLRWLSEELSPPPGQEGGASGRRVLVRRCYLNPVMYHPFRRPFHEAGFEIVDCPPMTAAGKTTTDIHIVLDTMDALADVTHFDEFIVFSADADFSPVLRRLRRHDRRTLVFAAGAMSEAYKASADRVIGIPEFLREALELGAEGGDDGDAVLAGGPSMQQAPAAMGDQALRQAIGERVSGMVLEAAAPVPLPSIAHALQRDFPVLKDGRWAGAGSFGVLMRQIGPRGVRLDFAADKALDEARVRAAGSAHGEGAPQVDMPGEGADEEAELSSTDDAPTGDMAQQAAQIVRRVVDASDRPVLLSLLGQDLRRALPSLGQDWAGAGTLAGLLRKLDLEPLRRTVLEDGSTVVLLDPRRHVDPGVVVSDALVASMLRAAEMPAVRPEELSQVLRSARPYMGREEPFEIATVSREVHETMVTMGFTISIRRVAALLQGLVFGGLETTTAPQDDNDLESAALGVILAAWGRETQAAPDDDARSRLLAWVASAKSN